MTLALPATSPWCPTISFPVLHGLPAFLPRWFGRPLELRIDVGQPDKPVEEEIEALYDRLHTPGDRLFGLPSFPLKACNDPDLVMRYREADGELYVYVEDVRKRQLAGYTVFNRLIELDRRADRHLRAPHSKYSHAYQRRGLATAVYRWALDAGWCLMSGARQSPGAHALWHKISTRHPLLYVDVREKKLGYLGTAVSASVLGELHTRMVLLGTDWTTARFCESTGMRTDRSPCAPAGTHAAR